MIFLVIFTNEDVSQWSSLKTQSTWPQHKSNGSSEVSFCIGRWDLYNWSSCQWLCRGVFTIIWLTGTRQLQGKPICVLYWTEIPMNVVDSRHWEKLPPLFGTDIMVLVGGRCWYLLHKYCYITAHSFTMLYNAVISMAGTQNP